MAEKEAQGEMVVVNLKLPRELVVELDHLVADLRTPGGAFPGRRSGLIGRMIRYGLDHQKEVLAE